jgi:hypothetical protein
LGYGYSSKVTKKVVGVFVRFRAPLQLMAPQEKVVHLLMESSDFNPIAMVRKEAQRAYFKDKILKLF